MTWLRRYRLRHYLRNSVWILPVCGMVAGMASVNCLHWIEQRAGWKSGLHPDAARALFGTLAGAMFTFIVFLASTLLLVLQMASAQLTPRIIGVVFRDRVTRFSLTLFAFTFTFTVAVLLRIEESVPALTPQVSGYLCVLSIGVFLFLIDHVGKTLRPSGALHAVARLGYEVIQNVYPHGLSGQEDTAPRPVEASRSEPACVVLNPKDGVFLAFNLEGLVDLARAAECVVELVPQVGDFVATGRPLFRIFGNRGAPSADALCQSVALGQERTLEQDPALCLSGDRGYRRQRPFFGD